MNPQHLPYFSGIPSTIEVAPVSQPNNSDVSTLETINLMGKYAKEGAKHPIVLAATKEALQYLDFNSASNESKARAIFRWIKDHVQFKADEIVLIDEFHVYPNKELLIRPERLVTMDKPQGDCDDFSMLAASMMLAAGLPVSYVTIAADEQDQQRFSHVYCLTYSDEGEKIAFDSSHGDKLGWESDRQFRRVEWPIYIPMHLANKVLGEIDFMQLSPEDKNVFSGRSTQVRGTGRGIGDIWSTIDKSIDAASKILTSRYAVPQLNPGQYMQQGSNVMYQLNPNQASFQTLPSIGGSSLMTYLMVGGAVIGGLMLLSSLGKS